MTEVLREAAAPNTIGDRPIRVVGVSGSLHEPSRTTALVRTILATVGGRIPADTELIEVAALGPGFAGALKREDVAPEVESALRAIETADLLVVASPVYRASFTGLFKHLFDFVGQYALIDKPVLLAATAGTARHSLVIEHALRPLFAYLRASILPTGVFAASDDWGADSVEGPLRGRIERAAGELAREMERREPAVVTDPFALTSNFEDMLKSL